MNYFDLIIGVGLLYGAIKGFSKGLIVEVASIIALILGVWGALHFAEACMEIMSAYINFPDYYGKMLVYFVLFVVIVFGVSWVAKISTQVIKIVALGFLNRLAGALFGICKWTLIFSALLLVVIEINTVFTIIPETDLYASILFTPLKQVGEWVFQWVYSKQTTMPLDQITMHG